MSVCCFSFFLHLSLLFENSSFLSDKIVLFWALAPRSVLEQVVGEKLRFACQCSIWFAKGWCAGVLFGERGLDASVLVGVGGPVRLIAQHESVGRYVRVRFQSISTFGE